MYSTMIVPPITRSSKSLALSYLVLLVVSLSHHDVFGFVLPTTSTSTRGLSRRPTPIIPLLSTSERTDETKIAERGGSIPKNILPDTNDPYVLLGLEDEHRQRCYPQQYSHRQMRAAAKEASARKIKAAYRKMARQYHPDAALSPRSTAEERRIAGDNFARINDAYETLMSRSVTKRTEDESSRRADMTRATSFSRHSVYSDYDATHANCAWYDGMDGYGAETSVREDEEQNGVNGDDIMSGHRPTMSELFERSAKKWRSTSGNDVNIGSDTITSDEDTARSSRVGKEKQRPDINQFKILSEEEDEIDLVKKDNRSRERIDRNDMAHTSLDFQDAIQEDHPNEIHHSMSTCQHISIDDAVSEGSEEAPAVLSFESTSNVTAQGDDPRSRRVAEEDAACHVPRYFQLEKMVRSLRRQAQSAEQVLTSLQSAIQENVLMSNVGDEAKQRAALEFSSLLGMTAMNISCAVGKVTDDLMSNVVNVTRAELERQVEMAEDRRRRVLVAAGRKRQEEVEFVNRERKRIAEMIAAEENVGPMASFPIVYNRSAGAVLRCLRLLCRPGLVLLRLVRSMRGLARG